MNIVKVLNFGWFCLFAVLAGCATKSAQMKATTGIVESHDGVLIAYESFGASETTAMFIHCWACNRSFWHHQIEPVTGAGYRVVTLDLPGHGASGADRETWSGADLAADIATVISTLDLEQVILVGHGMGGHLALDVASRVPERIVGIGCVAGLSNAEFEWSEGSTELVAAAIGVDFQQQVAKYIKPFLAPGVDPALYEWVVNQATVSDQSAVLALMVDFSNTDLLALFSGAGVPIRCINAEPSGSAFPPTEIETNRKYADFDAVLMEGVGQYPQLEQPEAFNAHLLDILEELSGRDR